MRKIFFIIIAFSTFLVGVYWYRNYDQEYYNLCKSPQKHTNFKNLDIEKQFQIYVKYNCKYDSLLAREYWGRYIGEKDEAIEFLLQKLRMGQDEDVLNHTLWMLRDAIRQQDVKGRRDITALVNQTIDNISDKDERSFLSKIIGNEMISRKKNLMEISTEIEERTKMSKAEYQEKLEQDVIENAEKAAKEAVRKIKEKQENTK